MYTYKMPTEIFFGRGSSGETGEKVKEFGCGKALVVTDKGVLNAGILDGIEESLKKSGIDYRVFSNVEPDPTIQGVAEGAELLKSFGAEIVIGVGGGSALDTMKAVAVMATNEGKIFDYVGFGNVPKQPLTTIAIPTTAGTGSEATFWSVLADKTQNIKASVGGWNVMPNMAILDSLLTKTLPPKVTAATGMDALVHAMESYVSKNTQPISEGMAIHAMKLIARSLRAASTDWEDLDARDDMLMGSLIAAFAFNITRLGNAHALAIPFGAVHHIPHGMVNAILLPYVMEFNLPASTEKYIEIAKIFGENVEGLPPMEAAAKSVDAIKKLLKDIGITEGLKDWGIDEQGIKVAAEKAIKSDNVRSNPRKTTVEDLISISQKALNGLEL